MLIRRRHIRVEVESRTSRVELTAHPREIQVDDNHTPSPVASDSTVPMPSKTLEAGSPSPHPFPSEGPRNDR